MSRFDAWNASFRLDEFHRVRDLLRNELGATFEARKRGLHGYHHSEDLIIDGARHGIIAWGGISRFFVEVKGEAAQRWYTIVYPYAISDTDPETGEEMEEPFVRLTRADVCFDWLDHQDTKALAPAFMAAVEAGPGRKVQWTQAGDWLTEEGRLRGCTLYMGSKDSPVMIRLYDKGREQIGKGNDAPSDLRRLEIVVKPKKDSMRGWAWLSPEYFWGASEASRIAAKHFGIGDAEGLKRSYTQKTDIETQMMYASVQYGEAIVELVRRAGGSPEMARLVESQVRQNSELHKELNRRKLVA